MGLAVLFAASTVLDTGPVGLLTWLLWIVTLGMAAVRPEYRLRRWTIIDALVFLFFISVILSTAFSSYRLTSLKGLEKMLTFLAAYLTFRTPPARPCFWGFLRYSPYWPPENPSSAFTNTCITSSRSPLGKTPASTRNCA
jgi:hypothetical protein